MLEKKLSFVFVVEETKQALNKKEDQAPDIDSRGNYILNGSFRNTKENHDTPINKIIPSYLIVLEQ